MTQRTFLDYDGLQRFLDNLKTIIPTKTSELQNDSGYLTQHNPVDSALSGTSENAVQNKVVKDALDSKAASDHTHGNVTNDGKLGTASRALITDSSKNITVSSVSDTELGYLSGVTSAVQTQLNGKSASTHVHGNITNDGKVGTTANKPLITGTGGVVQAGAFGTVANTFCEGNDSRLSDARTPVAHTHLTADITDLLSGNHTWTSQQSYNSDLNLNYANTDVDDIVNSVAGSAVLDNFVHMTGNETVNGIKSFPDGVIANVTGSATSATNDGSGNVISTTYGKLGAKNTWTGNNVFKSGLDIFEPNPLPAGIYGTAITFRDYQGNRFGYFQPYIDSDNNVNITIGADGSGRIRFNSDVIPYTSSAVNLGSSIYQWNNLYAKNYYYNGTQWGLDKNNTWTGKNQFNNHIHPGNVTGVDSCSFAFNAMYNTIFLNTRGSDNFPSYGTFLYAGYNQTGSGNPITHGQLQLLRSTDKRGETNNGEIPDTSFVMWRVSPNFLLMDMMQSVRVKNDGSVNQMIPITDSTTDLGTSTNKWKTFNGVNPGALSFPKVDGWNSGTEINAAVGIDTTNWDMTGGTWNEMTNNVQDGWVYFAFQNCGSSDRALVRYYGTDARYLTMGFNAYGSTGGYYLYIVFPMAKGSTVNIAFVTSGTVMSKYIYPCLGNV